MAERRLVAVKLYFLGFIPQGIWEPPFNRQGVRWWARPFMRYVNVYEEDDNERLNFTN